MAADRRFDGGVVEDVSAGNGEMRVLDTELGRVPHKGGHIVATLEGLFNDRATRARSRR